MKKRLGFFTLIILFVLSACAPAMSRESAPQAPAVGAPMEAPAMDESGGSDSYVANEETIASGAADTRIVIRNASLTIVVEDPAKAMSNISRMSETMGGFVVTSNLYKTYTGSGVEVPEASLTVRVPAGQLTAALDQIKALVKDPAKDIRSENVSGQDVTKEYTDLNSRLKNLEETESRLREIMGSAVRTEDVLAVNAQLTQIREQIEVIKGQIQYYQEAAALSSITVQIQALAAVQPIEIGGWQPVGIARDAIQALVDTMQFLAGAAIWLLVYVLPVVLVVFLPLRLIWWLIRRGRKNGKTQTPISAPPTAPPASN